MISVELLTDKNFNENSLDEYERRHDVKKVYRKKGSEYILVDIPYVEDWSLEEKREIAKKISGKDYISYIALGKAEAKKSGAKELYISACSSEETIAFYKAMGAVLTQKPIKEMAEKEPCDLQMICKVK